MACHLTAVSGPDSAFEVAHSVPPRFKEALDQARKEYARITKELKSLQVQKSSLEWDIFRYEDAIRRLGGSDVD